MDDFFLLPLVVSLPALVLIGATVLDVVRRLDLSGGRKIAWTGPVIVVPVVGTFIYLLARPFKDPARAPRQGNQQATDLVEAIFAHERGALSDDAFAAAKQDLYRDALGN